MLHLREITDPRSLWQQARRTELVRYAHELGIMEISEQMPKDLIIARLKARGVPPPNCPPRQIGSGPRSGDTWPGSHHYQARPAQPKQEPVEIDALDLAEREWKQQQAQVPLPYPTAPVAAATSAAPAEMSFNEMRKECKRLGVKMERRDRPDDLRRKLREHGEQNAA